MLILRCERYAVIFLSFANKKLLFYAQVEEAFFCPLSNPAGFPAFFQLILHRQFAVHTPHDWASHLYTSLLCLQPESPQHLSPVLLHLQIH